MISQETELHNRSGRPLCNTPPLRGRYSKRPWIIDSNSTMYLIIVIVGVGARKLSILFVRLAHVSLGLSLSDTTGNNSHCTPTLMQIAVCTICICESKPDRQSVMGQTAGIISAGIRLDKHIVRARLRPRRVCSQGAWSSPLRICFHLGGLHSDASLRQARLCLQEIQSFNMTMGCNKNV